MILGHYLQYGNPIMVVVPLTRSRSMLKRLEEFVVNRIVGDSLRL